MIKQFEIYQLEKWLHQNGAVLDDLIEGTLNDDCYYCGKRGFIAIIWQFETTWTSKAIAFFAPYKNEEACKKLWEMWDARRVAAECVPD
jgi:hypothetical protein